jgi:hypothetical protein
MKKKNKTEVAAPITEAAKESTIFNPALAGTKGHWTSIKEIEIPDVMFKPIQLGTPVLDTFLSEMGGLVPSQVIILTGEPGVGKTTLTMFMLSRLAERAGNGKINPPAFISLEMSDFQLKMQTRRIKGIDNVLLSKKMDDVQEMLDDLEKIQPSCVVLDSLQKASGDNDRKQLELAETFYSWAKKTFIPVIFIGHVNKDGKYKGPSSLLHEIDTHIHMETNKDTLEKQITIGKTRFGGYATPLPWAIESRGLRIGHSYFTPDGEKSFMDLFDPDKLDKVEAFKEGNYESAQFMDAAREILPVLKEKWRDELKGLEIDVDQLTFRFKPGVKDTYLKGRKLISFGMKTIDEWVAGTKSKYKGEHYLYDRYCRTHQDNAFHVICHEFAHIWDGKNGISGHNVEFFHKVHEVAKSVDFVFSEPSLVTGIVEDASVQTLDTKSESE